MSTTMRHRVESVALVALMLSGCATLPPDAGFT
jgi:hypothetical protein